MFFTAAILTPHFGGACNRHHDQTEKNAQFAVSLKQGIHARNTIHHSSQFNLQPWVPSSSSTQPRSCTPSSRASPRAAVSTASPSSRRLVVKPARSESEHRPPAAAQGTTTMKSSVPVPSSCRASSSPPAQDARLQPSRCPALTLPSERTNSHS